MTEARGTVKTHPLALHDAWEPRGSGELVHGAIGCPSHDEILQQDICASLLAAKDIDARDIEVQMTGAGVLLQGTVPTGRDRERALQIARTLAGTWAVREALTLRPNLPVGASAPSPSEALPAGS